MAPALDPAVLKALSLPASTRTTLSQTGGSNFAQTLKLVIDPDSPTSKKTYFMKTSSDPGAEEMFTGEHASLNAINDAVPKLCPRSLAHGLLEAKKGAFLVTEFLELGGGYSSRLGRGTSKAEDDDGPPESLAAKLARLHATPAPIPPGHDSPVFGFPVPTCCGSTPQDNTFTSGWATFYAHSRLDSITRACLHSHGSDAELRRTVDNLIQKVVPRLLGDGHLGGTKGIVPVVVHGDLWSGNKGIGSIDGRMGSEEIVYDPSACWAHAEFEHGIMGMFGGFGGAFWKEYWGLVEKTEPVEEYEDRVRLYELYHHLNHYALFGGGYRSGAMSIMKKLIGKYG